jgi:DNA invertase Pin-like site-specific DNA recombinase
LSFLRDGDQLVATKLDRVARSVRDLLEINDRVTAAGASLVILDQGYDFSTAHGRLVATILGAVAEMERTLIRDRTAEGRAAARRDGRSLGGRRPSIDRASVEALWNTDPPIPAAEIARRLRIAESSVYRIMGEKVSPPS